MNARGWSNPAVQPSGGAEWQLLRRRGGWWCETPSVTTASPSLTTRERWGRREDGKKRWLQATRWEGRRGWLFAWAGPCADINLPPLKNRWRDLAPRRHRKEARRGCVRRKRHFSCPRCPRRSISGERASGVNWADGWCSSSSAGPTRWEQSPQLEAPAGPVTCTLTPWVKSRRGGGEECKRSALSRFRGYRVN